MQARIGRRMAPQRDRGAALWLTVAAAAVAGLVAIYVSTRGLAPLPGAPATAVAAAAGAGLGPAAAQQVADKQP